MGIYLYVGLVLMLLSSSGFGVIYIRSRVLVENFLRDFFMSSMEYAKK